VNDIIRGVPGLGTLMNVTTVLLGTAVGVLVGARLPQRVRDTVMDGLGLLTFTLGISMAMRTENFMIVLGAVLLGGLTGELLQIERGLERLGDYFQARFASGSSTFSTGFVTASLLFCVGPLAILGSLADGLRGDLQILSVKSVLDGFAALGFATTLGWGVGLSALSLLIYQGGLTLGAGLFQHLLTDAMIREMTAVGGLLVFGIGLRLLDLRAVRVASFLPALIYAPLLVAVVARFH